MAKLKNFLLKRELATIFSLAGVAFIICFLVGYCLSGTTEFTADLSNSVIVPTIITLVLAVLFVAFASKMGRYLVFILLIYVLMEYINTQASYIANVFVAIDGTTFRQYEVTSRYCK